MMPIALVTRRFWLILLATILLFGAGQSLGQTPKGVVVEEVGEGSALEKAGLQAGDVVWAWEAVREPTSQGKIESVFDWMWLEREQAPQGPVKLIGQKKGVKRLFEMAAGKWNGKVRPRLPDRVLEVYLRGREKIEAGEIEQGVELWSRLTQHEEAPRGEQIRGWAQLRIGQVHAGVGAWKLALEAYLAALEEVAAPEAEVAIWRRIGDAYQYQGELDQAEAGYRSALEIIDAVWGRSLLSADMKYGLGSVAFRRRQLDLALIYFKDALEISEKLAPDSLYLTTSLNNVGVVASGVGQLDLAYECYQRALGILDKVAPDSLALTATLLSNLGEVARALGQLELASEHHQRGLEIEEQLDPNGLNVANSLNGLGLLATTRGRLELAREYYQRALEILEKKAPDSLELAITLNNQGEVARTRGQLELASEYFLRALKIQETLAPESLDRAASLNNLGAMAMTRGQLELASDFYERAQMIREKLAPESLDVAHGLNTLGTVVLARGQLELANSYHERALEIQKKQAPESIYLAFSFNNLGEVARAQGRLDAASEYHQRALEIQEKLAPDSLDLAVSLGKLGSLARERGRLELANDYHQRALKIEDKLAPNSLNLAQSLNDMGEVTRARGDATRAEEYFQRAIHTLEAQISNLGSSLEVKANFRAQYGEYYRNSIETLMQLRRPEEAFVIQESSRARAFLALLTERDLIFSDIPEDLDRQRRSLALRYEQIQEQLEDLNPRDHADQLDQLTSQLRDLRRQYEENSDLIRRASPRFAALRYPDPLGLEGVRQALDPGTVMLSYSVGKEQTLLFVLTREGPLQVHSLEVGEETLRNQLTRFDQQIRSHDRADRYGKGRLNMAQWLFRELIEPASATIAPNARLLIVPDGPLHRLPFAALVREMAGDSEPGWQYLVEWKPLHTVLSGSVYAELRKLRRNGDPPSVALVAFGDPQYPQALAGSTSANRGTVADVYVRDASERHSVKPLPHTRIEVETIASLFASLSVQIYLGKEATEERAKAISKDVRIVHFATHGLLNDEFPLNSALALTLPEEFSDDRENGLLQVWEIFERVRLDADLVVLSACQTAAGKEQFGEGLIGLSRAFQYAGARSVLGTLWNVPDRSTAELMGRFYRHLRSGQSHDEALRAAQLELISGEVKTAQGISAATPYHWAAFQVIGDWR